MLTIVASNRDRFDPKQPSTKLFVKSIQWQSCKDVELLIVDGGSKNYNEIQKYISEFEGSIPMRIIQHKIGDAFERALLNNVGIRNAHGNYIMTTDVDMMLGKTFVEELMNKVGSNVMVESRTMYWKSKFVQAIYNGVLDPYKDLDSCKKGRIKKRTTAGGCQCMSKESWEKVRGFDERYIGWGSEDYDLLTRAKTQGIKIKWMGEGADMIKLFHQPHPTNIKRDLVFQNENKKILAKANNRKTVNINKWGGIEND